MRIENELDFLNARMRTVELDITFYEKMLSSKNRKDRNMARPVLTSLFLERHSLVRRIARLNRKQSNLNNPILRFMFGV